MSVAGAFGRFPGLPRQLGQWLLLAQLSTGVLLGLSATAEAAIIERVVAVVGDKAILLTDVKDRAKPFATRLQQEVPTGAQRAAATSQLYRQLLDRMIDEELEERAAIRSKLAISAQEIDGAMERIASQNGMGVEQLVNEAIKSGLSQEDYRAEIRRQVLEAKLMNLRLQGRIRVTEEDLQTEYRRIVMDERQKLSFGAAWIVIAAPRTASGSDAHDRQLLAERISTDARRGEDFGQLAARWSEDPQTRNSQGKLGKLKPKQLPNELDRVLMGMNVGEVSPPIRLGDQLVVVKLLERDESSLPGFNEARDELQNRVYMAKMNKARRRWLEGLRRTTHVDVRL